MVTSQIFEDFSFCLSCKQYDRDKRWCELFKRTMACGCQYGEDKKPRNHFEAIKAMNMEQMAKLLDNARASCGGVMGGRNCMEDCRECWLKWLKEEIADA